jgi:hypothetical protein
MSAKASVEEIQDGLNTTEEIIELQDLRSVQAGFPFQGFQYFGEQFQCTLAPAGFPFQVFLIGRISDQISCTKYFGVTTIGLWAMKELCVKQGFKNVNTISVYVYILNKNLIIRFSRSNKSFILHLRHRLRK